MGSINSMKLVKVVVLLRRILFAVIVAAVVGGMPGIGGKSLAVSPEPTPAEPSFASSIAFPNHKEIPAPTLLAQAASRGAAKRASGGQEQARGGASLQADTDTVKLPDKGGLKLLTRDPLDLLRLDNIKPLYTSPALQGEGVWNSSSCPTDGDGKPILYTTFYRPSVDFPNAIVFMMVVDMSKVFLQYYVGSHEPGSPMAVSEVEPVLRSRIMAITNAMWMQRHSAGAGAIFRGKILYPMANGMATLITYKDGSCDIREWTPDIPMNLVQDARQLRHLIVKDGMVVQSVLKRGRVEDAEIGLGFLLGGGGRDLDGKHFWYVAHRSAFGIRKDGNLVFAIGHHIGSKDLAKALVLGGCDRGMHADANPHNIVGNLFVRDSDGNLVRKLKLSPEQSKYTLSRYEDGYTKDFFAFFLRGKRNTGGASLSRTTPGRVNQ
jgi:hypothetical protein